MHGRQVLVPLIYIPVNLIFLVRLSYSVWNFKKIFSIFAFDYIKPTKDKITLKELGAMAMVIFPATQKTEAGSLTQRYRDNLGNIGFQLLVKERHFQSKRVSSL